jgi:hypothetical protein
VHYKHGTPRDPLAPGMRQQECTEGNTMPMRDFHCWRTQLKENTLSLLVCTELSSQASENWNHFWNQTRWSDKQSTKDDREKHDGKQTTSKEEEMQKKKKKNRGLSPRANYTDRATAACRRSDCQLFADRGCYMVSVTDPYSRILGFLDRSCYFSVSISSVALTRLSGPRSRPNTFFSGSAENRTRASGSVAKNSDH